MTDPRRIEYADVDTLPEAARNAKAHDDEAIRQSLRRFGFTAPILLDERTGRIVAGHGRRQGVAALRAAGEEPPDGVRVHDGAWLVPVVRGWASTDDDHADAYAVADNRLTEAGGWDDRVLAEILGDLRDVHLLDVTGFTGDDLDALISDANGGGGSGKPEDYLDAGDDDSPAPPVDPISRPGDLWVLGRHRLLVGDAEDPANHARLTAGYTVDALLCDPPYGMRLDADWSGARGNLNGNASRGNRYDDVAGDHDDFDPRPVMDLYPHIAEQWWWGADYYAERIRGRNAGSWLVWDKRTDTQGDGIGSEFELAWSRTRHKRRTLRHPWFGFLTTADNAADARARVHPNQKPVSLLADIMLQWTEPGAVLADFYAGSGSTLVAAERTGRTALCMELLPAYADVICRRWQTLAGGLPVRDADSAAVDFTEPAGPTSP